MSVWKLLLRVAVGALLVVLLINEHEVGLRTVLLRMADMPALALLAAIGLELAGQTLCAYRWGRLSTMAGRRVGFLSALSLYFSGMFFNMCLPTSIGGDVFRVVGLGRQTGSKTAALASVFMDRCVGMAALLALGLLGSLLLDSTLRATLFGHLFLAPMWPLFLLMTAGYIAAVAVLFSDRLYAVLTVFFQRNRLGFASSRLEKLYESLRAYRLPLSSYAGPFIQSLFYQASEIALIYILARGLGIDVSPWVFCALVPFQAVACLLPITFNGMGIREAVFCAVLMGHIGTGEESKHAALALSLVYFFGVVLVSSLIGGVVYLVSGLTRPTVAEISESVPDAAGGGQ